MTVSVVAFALLIVKSNVTIESHPAEFVKVTVAVLLLLEYVYPSNHVIESTRLDHHHYQYQKRLVSQTTHHQMNLMYLHKNFLRHH